MLRSMAHPHGIPDDVVAADINSSLTPVILSPIQKERKGSDTSLPSVAVGQVMLSVRVHVSLAYKHQAKIMVPEELTVTDIVARLSEKYSLPTDEAFTLKSFDHPTGIPEDTVAIDVVRQETLVLLRVSESAFFVGPFL